LETRFRDTNADVIKTDLLLLPVEEKKLEVPAIRALDRRLKGKLSEQIQKSKFTGAEGASLLYSTAGTLPASHLLLVGFGKANDVDSDTWRKAGARAKKEASALGARRSPSSLRRTKIRMARRGGCRARCSPLTDSTNTARIRVIPLH
jgi:hypothetical protein